MDTERAIFVYGSNLGGRNGRGAALTARLEYGARNGIGVGRNGHAYAIPTKSATLAVLPLDVIEEHVREFIAYARSHPELRFNVTRIGCGLAGYEDHQIGPFFRDAPDNCDLPQEWNHYVVRSNEYEQSP
jgi:hypothetical protein